MLFRCPRSPHRSSASNAPSAVWSVDLGAVDDLPSENEGCFDEQTKRDDRSSQGAPEPHPEPGCKRQAQYEFCWSQDVSPVPDVPVRKRTHVDPIRERPERWMSISSVQRDIGDDMENGGNTEGDGPAKACEEAQGRTCQKQRDGVRDRKDLLPKRREIVDTKDLSPGSPDNPPLPGHHRDDRCIRYQGSSKCRGIPRLSTREPAGGNSHEQMRRRVHRFMTEVTGAAAFTAECGKERADRLQANPPTQSRHRGCGQYRVQWSVRVRFLLISCHHRVAGTV